MAARRCPSVVGMPPHDDQSLAREGEPTGAAERPPLLPVEERWSTADPAIRALVDIVNDLDIQLGVRLFLPGMILSGSLVSAPRYFEAMAAWLRESRDEEDLISEPLAQWYERAATQMRNEKDGDEYSFDEVVHVHMLEVDAFVPGNDSLHIGGWRGRLSEVTGWSMGAYSPDDDQAQ